MVGPRAKREAVRVVREEAGLSERRACGLIGMHRGSWRYQRRERNEGALRARLRELAAERPRFGYRRLYIFLRREKTEDGTLRWWVNHKRVYRLYREEGLAMQRRRRKRFRAEARVPLALPTRANEVWTMDYTHDELTGGRKFRTLNLMDGYTREALRIEPDTSLPGLRVVRILDLLRERRLNCRKSRAVRSARIQISRCQVIARPQRQWQPNGSAGHGFFPGLFRSGSS